MGTISDLIEQFGGEDTAYKEKLKTHFKNMMGYSNYAAEVDETASRPLQFDIKGKNLSNEAIVGAYGKAADIRESAVRSAQGRVDAINSLAGNLASEQASMEKAAASARQNATGLDNGQVFIPRDPLDEALLQYKQNPVNPDGTTKSLQQFEAELNAQGTFWDTKSNSDASMMVKYTPEEIKQRIQERIPSDFIGNEDKYMFLSRGYSEKQAEKYAGALEYMNPYGSQAMKTLYRMQNPEMAKAIDSERFSKEFMDDVGSTKDGNPANSFSDLKQKYPNMSSEDIKSFSAPIYAKSMEGHINSLMEVKYQDKKILDSLKKAKEENGYSGIMDTDAFKEILTRMKVSYAGMFNDEEIKSMIFNVALQRINYGSR